MMKELRVMGLWSKITRNVGEAILGMDRVRINLDPNQGEERTYSATSAEKRAHEAGMSR